MTEAPLVTIGISTYNRARSYLPMALDSALRQTYPNVEVVVSDNCSTDDTPAVIRSRAKQGLRYFRHDSNIGANNNFNFCLEQAKGEYFLLLHDDDLIDADFVETCVRAAGSREVGLIRTGTRIIGANNRVLGQRTNECEGLSPAELFLAWFGNRTAFYLCSTLYNTGLLREAGGFESPLHLYQDVTALARVSVPHPRVDVRQVKASFRRHAHNNGSSSAALAWTEDSLYLLGLLRDLLPEQADALMEAGRPYLCRKCYRVAGAIHSPVDRWRTYARIHRRFGHAYPPARYALERFRSDTRSAARQLMRGSRHASSTTT
jgi:glycosyltransferase involved in cell wall biosynthesis